MLAALLLTGLMATPIATVALFVRPPLHGRGTGAWPSTRRFVLALAGTAALAGVAAGLLAALGVTARNIQAGAVGFVVVSLLWLPVTRRWSARAHLCWAATTYLFLSYLIFMISWTFTSHLGVGGTIGGLILWLLEVFAAFLGCAYLWELCDALGRESWLRRFPDGAPTAHSPTADAPQAAVPATAGARAGVRPTAAVPGAAGLPSVAAEPGRGAAEPVLPFVSLQVPAYNEPPEMVIATLQSLKQVDYPDYEIIAIDDNTADESTWRPVEAWCLANQVKFVHLQDWPGYKSGALNHALRDMIDPRAELIGVIDADYQLDPQFLRRCAPLFEDPSVGFIQAPQDYRDWEQAPFYRRLYYSYKYFFAVSQPSRNERDGAIFAGTMGLIRRSALEAAGGWDEWCITEDAELSLRLLRDGWSGLHVDRSFGYGVMPLTFEALKGQRFRWCFGGIQILRRHWRLMVPGKRSARNRMDLGQRWAYLSGALQWYGDLLGLVFFVFLLVGAGNVALGGGLLFRKLTGFLLAAIPMLVILGFVRAIALLRRGTGASWRDAFGAFMIWQSTGLVVARASVQALFAREAEFLRTPKTAENARWWDAVRGNPGETALALLGLAGIVAALTHAGNYGGLLTAALLVWPTIAYASAPANGLSAQRAALPPELRARRRSEHQRYGTARRLTFAAAGLATIGAGIAIAVVLLTPGQAPVVPPRVFGPAQGQPANDHPPARSQHPHSHRAHSGPSSPRASTSPTPAPSQTTPTPAPTTSSTPSPSPTSSAPSSPVTTPGSSSPPSSSPPSSSPASSSPAPSSPASSSPTPSPAASPAASATSTTR